MYTYSVSHVENAQPHASPAPTANAAVSSAPLLSADHLAFLAARGISPDLSASAELYSVDPQQASELLGDTVASWGIAVACWISDASGLGHREICCVRLDHVAPGEAHCARPRGRPRPTYLPTVVTRETWRDPTAELVVVDSPIAALALAAAGIAALDIGDDGAPSVEWRGRRATLLYSGRRAWNADVALREVRVARDLLGRGAKVLVAELPTLERGGAL
ncbi:MAG: hypothetical protein IT379_39625 [Deltaproteobacteria bacterium]|nr:hypothetical protein [Deltaproteobacteria bacterium]